MNATQTKLTGGRQGFVAAIIEAFTTTANAPTVRYSHRRGFHTESGRHPADDDVLWSKLAAYTNGIHSIRFADYPEVRQEILTAESLTHSS